MRFILKWLRNVPASVLPRELDFSLLVPMLFLSLAVVAGYGMVSGINVLDGYRLSDLLYMTLGAIGASGLAAWLVNWLHAHGRKRVDSRTSEEEVLQLAGRLRALPVSTVGDVAGLELWRDDGAAAITPQIQVISYEDEINAVASRGQPGSAAEYLAAIETVKQRNGSVSLSFRALTRGTDHPRTGPAASEEPTSSLPLVRYRATPED